MMNDSRATSRVSSRATVLDPDNINFTNDDDFNDNDQQQSEAARLEDDELKRLSKYFEQSRAELQKKVESILNVNINDKGVSPSGVPYNQKNILEGKKVDPANVPGKPITLATATELRRLTVGSCVHRFSDEWRRAKLVFRKDDGELTYGLLAEKNGSKGLVLAVQAHVLKHLMIKSYSTISGEEVKDSKWQNQRRILNPNASERKDALLKSLVEILWNAGEGSYACVTLNGFRNSFDVLNDAKLKSNYVNDGLTEKLRYYEFDQVKHLEEFLRKNMAAFQRDDGAVLFIYSLILSRKLNKIKDDLQGEKLIGDMEECKIAFFNLVAVGVATPYVHNNDILYDRKGELLAQPEVGLHQRSEIGFIYWDIKEEDSKRTEVGSMLKTPKYPIWIALMNNLVAILFGTNMDLLNDWRLEQNFNLYFYGGLKKQESAIKINIDSRDLSGLDIHHKKTALRKFSFISIEEEKEPDILEVIRTKWPDCEVKDVDPIEIMSLL